VFFREDAALLGRPSGAELIESDAYEAMRSAPGGRALFWPELLARAAGTDLDEVAEALEGACHAGLVTEPDELGEPYAFVNPLVRRAILARVSSARRLRLARTLGETELAGAAAPRWLRP